mmetsp:Transcript_14383/g.48748  ORF Transcript_14383/g.48748 Transcript_14383/m.48748 type:complete len:120 (+) Transcript_14383:33-392(+)
MAGIRFCPACYNVLFAKEDKERKALLLKCEMCTHEEEAEDRRVVRTDINGPQTSLRFNFQDVVSDPTLPRATDIVCEQCGHNEAVFMKEPTNKDTEGLTLHFTCTNCKHNWKPDLSERE